MKNKFAPKWHPDYVEKLRDHLISGGRFTAFARVIKVDEATLYAWCREIPQFRKIKMEYEIRTRAKLYA